MIRASDLIGAKIRTESGERLGRVHDLRARAHDDRWTLAGLIPKARGVKDRLAGPDPKQYVEADMIPWASVTRVKDGVIIVRDGPYG